MTQPLRIYGAAGTPEDVTRCVASVYRYDCLAGQCRRKRGHGIGYLYCRQHAKFNP